MKEPIEYLEVSLPPCEKIDWDKKYYALILHSISDMVVYSTGNTVMECKQKAMEEREKFGVMSIRAWLQLNNKIMRCGLNEGVKQTSLSNSLYIVKVCDAKTHIYGEEFGYYRIRYIYVGDFGSNKIRFDKMLKKDIKGGKLGSKNARR